MNELHALPDAVLHEQLRFDAGRVLLKRDPRHADDLPITHSSIRRSAHPSAADQRPLQAARIQHTKHTGAHPSTPEHTQYGWLAGSLAELIRTLV